MLVKNKICHFLFLILNRLLAEEVLLTLSFFRFMSGYVSVERKKYY